MARVTRFEYDAQNRLVKRIDSQDEPDLSAGALINYCADHQDSQFIVTNNWTVDERNGHPGELTQVSEADTAVAYKVMELYYNAGNQLETIFHYDIADDSRLGASSSDFESQRLPKYILDLVAKALARYTKIQANRAKKLKERQKKKRQDGTSDDGS